MKISTLNQSFIVPALFAQFLSSFLADKSDGFTTINFSDSSYGPEAGGFRPVEIGIEKNGEDACIQYLTEYRYFGDGMLDKSTDFDFDLNTFRIEYIVETLDYADHGDYFNLYVANLRRYVKSGMLDEMELSQ